MRGLNQKLAVVRVTTLAAALMGVYGVAAADTGLVCNPTCPTGEPADNKAYTRSSTGDNDWVVYFNNAGEQTINGGSVTADGNKMRGVISTGGSMITLNEVIVSTNAGAAPNWGAHGVQATGNGSVLTINNTTISTAGSSYSLGVQSYDKGVVQGSNNTITAKGTNSFGTEASYGGRIELIGGSITTEGDNAAGARAFTGKSTAFAQERGFISLNGTSITTEKGVGLMAGDTDNDSIYTAGDITYKNATVVANGAAAARVKAGSTLTLENATLQSKLGNGITADGAGSTVTATNSVIKTSGIGDLNSAINASDKAVVNVTGGSIAATGLGARTRGILAQTGAKVTTNGTAISTLGNNSHAVHAHVEKGDITSTTAAITLNGGTVSTKGDNSYGLYALRGATITSSADVTTSGKAGFGAFVERNNEDDTKSRAGRITLNNGSITTTGEALDTTFGPVGSFGVLAKNAGSTAVITGTRIQTSGALAEGLRVEDGASISATNATVSTSGSGAHGVSVYGGGTVAMQGGSIAATGEGASAAFVKNNGTVILSGTSLSSTGATLASNFTLNGQVQTFTLGSGTSVLANNGELLRVTRGGEDADSTVVLNLEAGSFAQGNVYDMTGTKLVSVVKTGNAQWAGILVDQSTQQINPSTPPAPNYTTTENVIVTSTAPVTFTGATSMGGFSGATGGTSTFAGPASITGDLIGAQGSSTSFSNNANIGGSITSGSGSTTTFSGPSTTIGGSVGGNGGTFAFSRTGSTSIGGSLSLSGSSQVTGGTIDNPIAVGGDATVGAGSVLGGNLVVAGALGGSGGVLAPGNSIGTQTYGSSAGFTGDYAVEVNAAGKSDLIIISNGNFDLSNIGLGVGQENGNGGYVLNHDYTIIQTPGGLVQNTFKSTALDNSFAGTLVKLDPVKYGAKDVKVSLSVDNSAAQAKRAGLTGNQNATLDGVLSVAGKNTAADAALQSTDTAGAMNQLSGEVHASTSSALLAAGGLVQRTVAQRMRGNLGAGMTAGAPTAQAGGTPVAGSLPQSAALPLWAQVVGNWNTLSDDGNAGKVKSNMGGVFIGGDAAVGSGWRVGGALGFTDGQIDVDDRSSRTKARSYTASLYGGNSWATGKGSVNFLAGAAYTRHNLDSRRSITLAGGQKLTADYHANSAQLFTELGYALLVGANSVVEPYAGLAWLSQRMQGFSESGGSAALRGDSQTDTVTTFTLGLRGKTTMELSADKRVTLFAGLGWRHASGDVTSSRNVAFIQGNGASFQVSGAPIAKNAALLDAGVEASLGRNAALGLSYNGQYGNGNTNHVGSLYLKMRF